MAQVRKLWAGGQPTSPPTTDSPKEPQLLTVGNTEYNMDTYIRELENNFEGWLDSTNFSDKEKNEQRRLLPIFVQKLRSGVVTPLEGGGWRDSSLEMYNEKKGHDKWGALAWFATEGLRHQKPYNPNATTASENAVEYDPSKGLESLRVKIFGPSTRTFVSLDDFTDNTKTARGLKNRSARVFNALTDIRGNLDKYFTFKNPGDRTDLESKIDYILGTVIGDSTKGTGNGLIDPNEHFYLSEIGLGDVTDLFATDFSKPASPTKQDGGGSGDGALVPPAGDGNGNYGNSFTSEVMSTWLTRAGDTYKVKKTPNIGSVSFGSLKQVGTNTVNAIKNAIISLPDQKKITRSINEYFYNRKPGALKYDQLLDLFSSNLDLQGFTNVRPAEVVGEILKLMVTNNSTGLESIGNSKFVLSGTLTKNNTVLMYDSANRTLSEVSAFYSPKFRQKVLNKFYAETGIIPTNIDWYSGYYKQGGVLIARGGTRFDWYRDFANRIKFADDVTDDSRLRWNPTTQTYEVASQAYIDTGATTTDRATVLSSMDFNNFNTLRTQEGVTPENQQGYIGFNYDTGTWSLASSNKEGDKVLPYVWKTSDWGINGPEKGSIAWRVNKSKGDYTYENPFVGDEAYTGDINDQGSFQNWLAETNAAGSGWAGVYYSPAGNDGKGGYYRTKTAPAKGGLLTASMVNEWKPKGKEDELETLTQGPSNFDKFMQFFGPAVGDVAAGIFTHQRNNRGLEKMKDAMHPNLKTMPNEVYDPLRMNYAAWSAGHTRGMNIESTAQLNAANYTDPSLALAASRQGTLDRATNDATVDATVNQDLQSQIQARTTAQNTRNALAAQTAFENQSENNRVELARATAEVENDKTNTEVWNKIMAKYASQVGDYFTSNVTKKQEIADTANKLQAQAWLDDAMVTEKAAWKSRNPGASDSDWLMSTEYKKLKLEFNRMLALGSSYTPSSGTGGSWSWVSSARNGGVLSLRAQALLNKIVK